MPRRAPVGKFRYPRNVVKDVKDVEAPPPVTLWDVASDVSRWFHPDAAITTLPYSYHLHIRTTLQTAERYFLVTLSPSVNGSGRLMGVDCGWFFYRIVITQFTMPDGMRSTYRNYFRHQSLSCEWQKSGFHLNTVGVNQLVCRQFLKVIFSKPKE